MEYNAATPRLDVRIDQGTALHLAATSSDDLTGATCSIKILTTALTPVATVAGVISGNTMTWTVPAATLAPLGSRCSYIASWTRPGGEPAGLFKGAILMEAPAP